MLTRVLFANVARSFGIKTTPQTSRVTFTSRFSTVADTTESASKNITQLETEYASEIKDVWNSYEERKKRKQNKVGVVVSTKCMKTINVEYAFRKFFPKYNIYMTRHRRLQAHDETEQAKLGDIVRIVPCRPRSRTKHHELIDIIRRNSTASAVATPKAEKI